MRMVGLIGIIGIVIAAAGACSKTSEEDRVRSVIGAVQDAVQEKRILAVLDHLSAGYRDPQGNDKDGIKGLLGFYFYRHQRVNVAIPAIDVTLDGPSATANFQAILSARGTDGEAANMVLPDAMGVYDFRVTFRKEADRWKVTSAAWSRAGGGAPASP